MNSKPFCVYILKTVKGNRSYVGKTNDMHRRYRQHIKQLVNGARYTSCIAADNDWIPVAQVVGFESEKQALQFEYAMKQKMSSYRSNHLAKDLRKEINRLYHNSVKCGNTKACSRVVTLLECISLEKWTPKAVDAQNVPLQIIWYGTNYRPMNLSQFLISVPHITDVVHHGIDNNKVTIYQSRDHVHTKQQAKDIFIKVGECQTSENGNGPSP